MLADQVLNMTPGEVLDDVPIDAMVQKMGQAVAEAQLQLDQVSIRVATILSETDVEMTNPDGTKGKKSLLELGFTPTFYHFTEAKLEVKMSLTMKVEAGFKISGSLNVGTDQNLADNPSNGDDVESDSDSGDDSDSTSSDGKNIPENANRPVLFGAAINASYQRKYNFDVTASSSINATLVSIPAPAAFLEALKDNARYAE